MITGLKSQIDGVMMTELHMTRKSPTSAPNLEKVEFAYVLSSIPGKSGPALVGKVGFIDPWTPEIAETFGKLIKLMEEHMVSNSPLFESRTEAKAPVTLAPIIPWEKSDDPEDAA